jgi:DUF4097 and DUF4098 domain-containing protein YvlB
MKRPRPLIRCLASLIPLVLQAPWSHVEAQSERQRVSGASVAIYNLAGRVRVESGSGSDVTVNVSRGGRDAGRLRVATSEIRGRNTFRVIYPTGDDIVYRGESDTRRRSSSDVRVNDDGTWGGGDRSGWRDGDRIRVKSSGSGTEAWADLTISVPAGKTIAVYLAVGELTATNVDGEVLLDVSSARVTTTGSRGRLSVDAGSGGVELRDASLSALDVDIGSGSLTLSGVTSERCTFDTGSGGVRGTGARCGTLSVDVGSGSVRLDDVRSSDVSIDAGSGGVTLSMLNSPRAVTVDAGSGGVTLSLPSDLSADVEIETGSGGISTDFPVRTSRVERRSLRGTIGDGAGRIRIETGSGSVRLLKTGT